MPNYNLLAQKGTYSLSNGISVFAGQRDDPFYIDLGGLFDTLNLGLSPLPIETDAQDANDGANAFGVDMLPGFNVQEIALEIPASMLTLDGKGAGDTQTPLLGGVAATYRPLFTSHGRGEGGQIQQVQRLANPLVNEAIIGTPDKDAWNAIDNQAAGSATRRTSTSTTTSIRGWRSRCSSSTACRLRPTNRTDLRDLLLTYGYPPQNGIYSDLLRLNLHVPPTPLASQKRLGPLAHDANGHSTPTRPPSRTGDGRATTSSTSRPASSAARTTSTPMPPTASTSTTSPSRPPSRSWPLRGTGATGSISTARWDEPGPEHRSGGACVRAGSSSCSSSSASPRARPCSAGSSPSRPARPRSRAPHPRRPCPASSPPFPRPATRPPRSASCRASSGPSPTTPDR